MTISIHSLPSGRANNQSPQSPSGSQTQQPNEPDLETPPVYSGERELIDLSAISINLQNYQANAPSSQTPLAMEIDGRPVQASRAVRQRTNIFTLANIKPLVCGLLGVSVVAYVSVRLHSLFREDSLACPTALDDCKAENFQWELNPSDVQELTGRLCAESTKPCHGDKLNACADPTEVGLYGSLNAALAIHTKEGGDCPDYFKKGSNCESSNLCNINHKSIRNAQGVHADQSWSTQKLADLLNWTCEQLAEENIDCANDACPTLAHLVDNSLNKMEKSSGCPV